MDFSGISFKSNYTQSHAVIEGYILAIPLPSVAATRYLLSLIRIDLELLASKTQVEQSELKGLKDFAELYNNELSMVYPHHVAEFQLLFRTKLSEFVDEISKLSNTELQDRSEAQTLKSRHTGVSEIEAALAAKIDPGLSSAQLEKMRQLQIHLTLKKTAAEICISAGEIIATLNTCFMDERLTMFDDTKSIAVLHSLKPQVQALYDVLGVPNPFITSSTRSSQLRASLVKTLKLALAGIIEIFNQKMLAFEDFVLLPDFTKTFIVLAPNALTSDICLLQNQELRFVLTAKSILHATLPTPQHAAPLLHKYFGSEMAYIDGNPMVALGAIYKLLKHKEFTCAFINECPQHVLTSLLDTRLLVSLVTDNFLNPERLKNLDENEILKLSLAAPILSRFMQQNECSFDDMQHLSMTTIMANCDANTTFTNFFEKTDINAKELFAMSEDFILCLIKNPMALQKIEIWLNYYFKTKQEFLSLTLADLQKMLRTPLWLLPNIVPTPRQLAAEDIKATLSPAREQFKLQCEYLAEYGHVLNLQKFRSNIRQLATSLLAAGLNFECVREVYQLLLTYYLNFSQHYFSLLQDFTKHKDDAFIPTTPMTMYLKQIAKLCNPEVFAAFKTFFEELQTMQDSCLKRIHEHLCNPEDVIHYHANILADFKELTDVIEYIERNMLLTPNENINSSMILAIYSLLERRVILTEPQFAVDLLEDWQEKVRDTSPEELFGHVPPNQASPGCRAFMHFYITMYYMIRKCEFFDKVPNNYYNIADLPSSDTFSALKSGNTTAVQRYFGNSTTRRVMQPIVIAYNDLGESYFAVARSSSSTLVKSAVFDAIRDIKRVELRQYISANKFSLDNLDVPNSNGETALTLAIKQRRHALVQILLVFGADPKVANRADEFPLQLACETGLLGIIKDLRAAGAELQCCERAVLRAVR